MNEQTLQQQLLTTQTLKKSLGLTSLAHEVPTDIDLERLALLIDPMTTTRLYSQKKIIGPLLTWMRTGFVRLLYFLFRLDFSRVIELHQNVWLMAYQMKQMQTRLEQCEAKLMQEKKNS